MTGRAGAVLVSGVSGVLGQPLVKRLREQGYPVYEITRKEQETEKARKITWDLESGPVPGLPDIEYYIHCAPVWVLPDNISGLAAAGVKRVVAFSSSSAISKQDSTDADERALAELLRKSEDEAIRTCRESGLSLTLFRPTMIYGFGRDQNVSRIARILSRYRCGVISGKGSGQRQPVHVLDLVDAVEKVLENPRTFNKTYILNGGETLTYREMMRRIFVALGLKPRIVSIPPGVFRFIMRIAGLISSFSYTPAMVDRMNRHLSYDSDAAARDFNYFPSPFLEDPARDLPGLLHVVHR